MIPGEIIIGELKEIILNANAPTIELVVTNSGDKAIFISAFYPFEKANAALQFNRNKAAGYRLDIPSYANKQFLPGDKLNLKLTKYKN